MMKSNGKEAKCRWKASLYCVCLYWLYWRYSYQSPIKEKKVTAGRGSWIAHKWCYCHRLFATLAVSGTLLFVLLWCEHLTFFLVSKYSLFGLPIFVWSILLALPMALIVFIKTATNRTPLYHQVTYYLWIYVCTYK